VVVLAIGCGKSETDVYVDKAQKLVKELVVDSEVIDSTEAIMDVPLELSLASEERKIRKVPHRGLFRTYLIQCGKAKFGSIERSSANVMVVRKFLYDICIEQGLLPRHIMDHLDISVEMVFIPTDNELTQLAIPHTREALKRKRIAGKLRASPPRGA
jgi:hypothetical protein